MYTKTMLTLLVAVLAVIAIDLARPPRRPEVLAPNTQDVPCPAELKLAQHIAEVNLHSATPAEAVELLQKKTGAVILVKWETLSFPSTPWKVDLDLHDVSLGGALRSALNGADRVVINARGNVIEIAAFDAIASDSMTLRVYDVSDLLTDAYWGVGSPPQEAENIQEVRLAAVARTVEQFVYTETWDRGYAGASLFHARSGAAQIGSLQRKLVVLQSSDGHRSLVRLLAQLRQVSRWPGQGGKQ